MNILSLNRFFLFRTHQKHARQRDFPYTDIYQAMRKLFVTSVIWIGHFLFLDSSRATSVFS